MPICAINAATLVDVSEDAAIFRPWGPTQEKLIILPTSKRIQIAEALSKIYDDMSAYAIMHDNAATGRSSIVRSIMPKNFS
jgi:hypothetical protein